MIDQTSIKVVAGKGGNGCIAFRKEKFVPRGGPNGGNGGRGGNVIFKADENYHTLIDLHSMKMVKAEDGGNGKPKSMTGKMGEDLIVKVPVGTLLHSKDKKQQFADLTQHGQEFIVAKGGKGGYGNEHFKSSRYQVPRVAELGEPGEEKEITLELRMIADVGVIGLPSAGKSSLLNAITRSHAKVAAYPFTTLSPNLGVVDLSKKLKESQAGFVMADIPGLIEGAHEGKGLGHEFLRHITRTKILIHLIDITTEDVKTAKKIIEKELSKYDKKLGKKKQIVVFNKIDLIPKEDRPRMKGAFYISCATGEGLDDMLIHTYRLLKETEKEMAEEQKKAPKEEHKIFKPLEDSARSFEVKYLRKNKVKYFQISGKRIEQVAVMTDLRQPEGLLHLRHYIKKLGIQRALIKEGAAENDMLMIADKEIHFKIID